MKDGKRTLVSRRRALATMGAAGAELLGARLDAKAQTPAVRRKVNLTFWAYSDNPSHQQKLVDAVNLFNGSQSFVDVQINASARTGEIFQKVAVAHAAGAAPDIATIRQDNIQECYDSGILYPVEELFNKWDQRADYLPVILDAMRSRPNQPALYLPDRMLCYVLWYRADWFEEAKLEPPKTYDQFIAAAKTLTKAPDRYGYALRGGDYYGYQALEAVWASAGVKFVDENGKVDLDSPQAIAITEKWLEMFTKDKSVQPTAVSDIYPQLFALMERGKCGMWIYGTHASPQLSAALGDRIQVVASPWVDKPCTEIIPAGLIIDSLCKEKEAAWEFLTSIASAPSTVSLGPQRGYLPVRKSIAAYPEVQNNRHMKVGAEQAANWWMPPFSNKYFQSFEDRIGPYWQEALRQSISAKDLQVQAANLLRGKG